MIFFTILIIFAFFTLVYLIMHVEWRRNKRITADALKYQTKHFKDLKIKTNTYGKWKTLLGITIKGQLFISPINIIITGQNRSIRLFLNSSYPFVFSRRDKNKVSKLIATDWKTVQLSYLANTASAGLAEIELIIEAKDQSQQQELYKDISEWVNSPT